MFANLIVPADLKCCDFAGKFKVLRLVADTGERKDLASRADTRMSRNHHVRHEDNTVFKLDVWTDDGIRSDRNGFR